MKVRSHKDFWSGLMFMGTGGGFAVGATSYTIGEGARMGPGYFPLMLGILLVLIGMAVVFQSLVVETEDGEPVGRWAWRPLGFIIGANVIFGVCLGGLSFIGLPPMGLIVGIYALTFISALASNEFRAREVAVVATILALGSYLTFVVALKLQFPVWPTFLVN